MHAARVGVFTPLVKAWCTDGAVEIASTAIQVHGGAGYIEETGIAQHLRDARITPIYEGTNGIQALDLVRRKLAGDSGLAIGAMVEEMRQFDAVLEAASTNPSMALIRARLAEAGAALSRTTHRLLDATRSEPALADAAAVPYLEMLASVLGGYLMARAAVAASRHLRDAAQGDGFYVAKIATAEYYAAAVLPRAASLEHVVAGGAASVFGLGERNF
jgi:hypothetical protein